MSTTITSVNRDGKPSSPVREMNSEIWRNLPIELVHHILLQSNTFNLINTFCHHYQKSIMKPLVQSRKVQLLTLLYEGTVQHNELRIRMVARSLRSMDRGMSLEVLDHLYLSDLLSGIEDSHQQQGSVDVKFMNFLMHYDIPFYDFDDLVGALLIHPDVPTFVLEWYESLGQTTRLRCQSAPF